MILIRAFQCLADALASHADAFGLHPDIYRRDSCTTDHYSTEVEKLQTINYKLALIIRSFPLISFRNSTENPFC